MQVSKLPDGTSRVALEGIGRVRIRRLTTTTEALRASVVPLVPKEAEPEGATPDHMASISHSLTGLYGEYARLHERIPEESSGVLSADGDLVRFAHLVSGHLILPAQEKQEVLETKDLRAQLDILREILVREVEILRIERKLDRQIQLQLGGKKAFGLGHESKDLGVKSPQDETDEWTEIEEVINKANLPPHADTRAEKELGRLRKLNPVAPEAAVIRTHLDWITSLPWSARSQDSVDVKRAASVLELAHFGLGEVKERILDHVAVLSLVQDMRGPILCLVGPPGVGKTSLGRSIADALEREFVRVSLGGVRDEAEIRGHRRTYVGALPGRIIQGMRRSGTRNPVFLLDEVDKLARDFHGDPGAALLEVLDPEQNRAFTDHYLELEFDLSDVLFVATANTLQGIPEPLRDRMEVIRLPGYLDTEKREIASRFLWPRQAERHGLEEVHPELSFGLAWTASGGEVLDVEVAIVPGAGNVRLTGTLGEVMKESAQAAVTYARSRAKLLGLEPLFQDKVDIHIHIPEGATPKDGPSAGITIAVALISALTGTPTRADVAMTGEITLRGRVLGVGGVKEKAVAALRSGMRRVVLPTANVSDLELLPQEVREQVVFDLVRTMDEVMNAVLVQSPLHVGQPALETGVGVSVSHG